MHRLTDIMPFRRGGLRFLVVVGALAGTPWLVDAQSTYGWILAGKKDYTTKGSTATTTWEPQDGFELLAECRMSAQEAVQSALKYVKDSGGKLLAVRPDGRFVVFEVTESGVQQRVDASNGVLSRSFDPRARP